MMQFDHLAYTTFQSKMQRHAVEFAPAACAVMGDDGVVQTVARAFERAEAHGFTRCGPLRFFVELALMFGEAFETDPQCPWVAPSLRATEGLGELTRADALHAAMTAHLDRIFGADGRAEFRARDRILAEADHFLGPAATPAQTVANYQRLYPEKAETIGSANVTNLVAWAFDAANRMRFDTARFGPLFTALMSTYGHGCLSDPQFPWISKTLQRDQEAEMTFQKLKDRYLHHIAAAGA